MSDESHLREFVEVSESSIDGRAARLSNPSQMAVLKVGLCGSVCQGSESVALLFEGIDCKLRIDREEVVGTWIDVVCELEDVVAVLSWNGFRALGRMLSGLLTKIQDLQSLRYRQDASQATVADIALLQLKVLERFGCLALCVLKHIVQNIDAGDFEELQTWQQEDGQTPRVQSPVRAVSAVAMKGDCEHRYQRQ